MPMVMHTGIYKGLASMAEHSRDETRPKMFTYLCHNYRGTFA